LAARRINTAEQQDLRLQFDKSLVDHLAEVGYDPEFGARMLKRKLRSEVESRLATALLKGDLRPGSDAMLSYNPAAREVKILQEAEHKAAA
jgi:ATP-dependent Clp protease ATP-binding subunit ClpC